MSRRETHQERLDRTNEMWEREDEFMRKRRVVNAAPPVGTWYSVPVRPGPGAKVLEVGAGADGGAGLVATFENAHEAKRVATLYNETLYPEDTDGRTDTGRWRDAAIQAKNDLRAIEGTFRDAKDWQQCPIGPGSVFAAWSSPAVTMRWIEDMERGDGVNTATATEAE